MPLQFVDGNDNVGLIPMFKSNVSDIRELIVVQTIFDVFECNVRNFFRLDFQ